MSSRVDLILGGARSGKSRLAEQRAVDTGLECVYVATATAQDDEMAARIATHQEMRGEHWVLVEEPVGLGNCLSEQDNAQRCILVDCLTLWLSNCLHAGVWEHQREQLLVTLPTLKSKVVLVSNETGLGVVPMGELSRRFVDEAGFLHQALASICDDVTLTVAGLPLSLKTSGQ